MAVQDSHSNYSRHACRHEDDKPQYGPFRLSIMRLTLCFGTYHLSISSAMSTSWSAGRSRWNWPRFGFFPNILQLVKYIRLVVSNESGDFKYSKVAPIG